MTRRRRWFAALAAGLAFVLFGLGLPLWTAWLLEGRLAAAFERPTRIESVQFRLSPFRVEILGLWVGGYAPDALPFLVLPRAVVVPSLTSLWGPDLALERLWLEGLVVRVNAFPEGGDDIPRPQRRRSSGGGAEVRIGRLTISGGAFVLDHRRVPLELDLPEFRGRLIGRGAGVLAGRISFGPGQLGFSTAPDLPLGTELNLLVDGPTITVESGRVTAEGTDIGVRGQILIQKDPVGEFQLEGPVDLEVLERHVMQSGLGIKGDGHYSGTLSVYGSRLRIKGRMYGTDGEFWGIEVPRFDGGLDWDELGVHLRGLTVEALDGTGVMDVEVPPGRATATWSGTVEHGDGEGIMQAIFDIGSFGVGGATTGDFAIEWPKGRFREGLTGRLRADITPLADGRDPVRGFIEWSALEGVQFIEDSDLHSPHTQARFQGRIEVDDGIEGTLTGTSSDFAATDNFAMRVRRALGTPDTFEAGFSGRGSFRGEVRGTLDVPVFDGRVDGEDVGWLGVVWGRGRWVGVADPYLVDTRSAVVQRPGAALRIEGWSRTGYYGEDDGIGIVVRLEDWPAEDFIKALDWDLETTGPMSGQTQLTGRRSVPVGKASITGSGGLYYGIPYSALEVDSAFEGAVAWGEGRATVGGGSVTFKGTMTDDGVFDGEAAIQEVDLGSMLPAPSETASWGGRLSGSAQLLGTLGRPRLIGELTSDRIFLGDEGVGALEASVQARGDGEILIEASCRSPRVSLVARGRVGALQPYPIHLQISARDTSVDPFLRAVYPGLSSTVGIISSGEVQLQGSALAPEQLSARVQATDLQIRLPDYPISNGRPLELTLQRGRLILNDVALAGEGTDLSLAGSAAVFEDGPLDVTVLGAADLRALTAVTNQLRGRGDARLQMTIGGRRDAPEIRGTLAVEGAGVRARGFPHGLESVRGAVEFTEKAARFSGVTGRLAGGTVELEGQAAYGGGGLGSFEIEALGRSLALRYPEGLRSLLDAEIRFFGDAEQQWVTGGVDVRQASWTRRYDLASEILSSRELFPGASSLDEGIRYDVTLSAPGTVRVDNNLTTLQASAELRLQGTSQRPVILGRAEVDRGRVYFQGNTYVIRRGVIDFSNPQRMDPLFDIEAETRVRSYRVQLRVNGTLERVSPTLTSDPPLSAVQILSLLAGADEADVASLTQVRTDQANLAATGAATLAAGRIAEEVGLERGAERLFGLNRFSIDPSIIKGGVSNPTARVTVGKRITPDFNVLYSVDLRGTEQRVLSIEYNLSDRLSVLITRNENPSEMAFDLRLIRSYR